jgi:hypothetical protein
MTWTEENLARLKAAIASGRSSPEIARELGITATYVRYKASKLGLRFGRTDFKWTPDRTEELKRLVVAKKFSARLIGKRLGVGRNAVIGKVHRLGLRLRTPKVRLSPGGQRRKVAKATYSESKSAVVTSAPSGAMSVCEASQSALVQKPAQEPVKRRLSHIQHFGDVVLSPRLDRSERRRELEQMLAEAAANTRKLQDAYFSSSDIMDRADRSVLE